MTFLFLFLSRMDCPTFRAGFILKLEESSIAGQLPDDAGRSKGVSARPLFDVRASQRHKLDTV